MLLYWHYSLVITCALFVLALCCPLQLTNCNYMCTKWMKLQTVSAAKNQISLITVPDIVTPPKSGRGKVYTFELKNKSFFYAYEFQLMLRLPASIRRVILPHHIPVKPWKTTNIVSTITASACSVFKEGKGKKTQYKSIKATFWFWVQELVQYRGCGGK